MTLQGRIVVEDTSSRQEEEANIVSTQGRHHIAARSRILHKEQCRHGEHVAPSQRRIGPKKLCETSSPSQGMGILSTQKRKNTPCHRGHNLSTGDIIFPPGTLSFHRGHHLSAGVTSSSYKGDTPHVPRLLHCENDPNRPSPPH